jgi:hypothetical protein
MHMYAKYSATGSMDPTKEECLFVLAVAWLKSAAVAACHGTSRLVLGSSKVPATIEQADLAAHACCNCCFVLAGRLSCAHSALQVP